MAEKASLFDSDVDALFRRNLNFGSIYLDIQNITAKLHQSGFFGEFARLLADLHQQESRFTLKELQKIVEGQDVEMDFEREFLSNAIIFKANLKLILAKLVDDIWETSAADLKEAEKGAQKGALGQIFSTAGRFDEEYGEDILVDKEASDDEGKNAGPCASKEGFKSFRNKQDDFRRRTEQATCKKTFKQKTDQVDNKTSAHKPVRNVQARDLKPSDAKLNTAPVLASNGEVARPDWYASTGNVNTLNGNTEKGKQVAAHSLAEARPASRTITTNKSFVSSCRRGHTGERRPEDPEAVKIAKLIGAKNKDLDSEFLHKHNSCTFSKAKREFRFAVPEGPGPSKYATESDNLNFIKRNVYSGAKFGKARKTFFEEEAPRTETPGPAYKVRKTFCS